MESKDQTNFPNGNKGGGDKAYSDLVTKNTGTNQDMSTDRDALLGLKDSEKQEVLTRNVGIDLGYGFVKFIDDDKDYMFPSIVGSGDEIQYKSEMFLEDDPLKNMHIEIGNETFFVGDLAIRQSQIASRSLDQDRSKDKNAKVLMLTALTLLCKEERQEFNLVTGLPTNYYAAYKDDWEEVLLGNYKTNIWRSGTLVERSFQVKNTRIVPQPFGTLFNSLLSHNGDVVDRDLPKEMVGIVDIGFKTTDLAVSNNVEFIERLSFSIVTGLSTIYRYVGEKLRREFKVDKEDYQLDECINSKTVRIAGKEYDISNWVDNAFKLVAGKIATEIESKWDFKQFDRILLTGGGGKVLSPYIVPGFPNMVMVEDSQLANVRGFQKLSNKIFSGK